MANRKTPGVLNEQATFESIKDETMLWLCNPEIVEFEFLPGQRVIINSGAGYMADIRWIKIGIDDDVFDDYCNIQCIPENIREEYRDSIRGEVGFLKYVLQCKIEYVKDDIRTALPKWLRWII